MLEELVFEEFSAYFKIFYDFLIGVFYELTRVRSNGFDESAAIVYHLYERKIILSADVGVVFAERGRDMNYACSVGKRNVIVVGYVKRLFFERTERVREHRFVLDVFVVFTFLFAYEFVFFEKSRH